MMRVLQGSFRLDCLCTEKVQSEQIRGLDVDFRGLMSSDEIDCHVTSCTMKPGSYFHRHGCLSTQIGLFTKSYGDMTIAYYLLLT